MAIYGSYDPGANLYADNVSWRKMPFAIYFRNEVDNWTDTLLIAFGLRKSGQDNNANKALFDIEHTNVSSTDLAKYINSYIDDANEEDGNIFFDQPVSNDTKSYLYDPRKENVESASSGMPYSKMYLGSTEIGYNDTINCLPQFNHDDDIAHQRTTWFPDWGKGHESDVARGYIATKQHWISMGRVYLETFQSTQSIMWICAGVPVFNSMLSFYLDSYDEDMSEYAHRGGMSVGSAIFSTASALLQLPLLPLKALKFVFLELPAKLKAMALNTVISKYFEFKPTMHAYYEYVNSLLIHLAVNLRIIPIDSNNSTGGFFDVGAAQTGGQQSTTMYTAENISSLPYFLQHDFDILTIINRRLQIRKTSYDGAATSLQQVGADVDAYYKAELAGDSTKPEFNTQDQRSSADEYLENTEGKWIGGMTESIIATALGMGQFVGFRIDKTASASESFSNSSSQPEIASTLHSMASQGIERRTKLMEGNLAGDNDNILSQAAQGFVDLAAGIYDKVKGLLGMSATDLVVKGKGYFDIPEIWKESSFSKSYSFEMRLRSPYGDPISIFTNIYIPCIMILCLALPRSVGRNSYTSPFLVQAYCRGQFAIPCGLIESVSIDRGGAEHGWTYTWLPTKLSLTFSIKDLSPILHIAIAGGISKIDAIFATNSSMQEYLLTLAGTTLTERRGSYLLNLKRRWKIALKISRSKWLNKYWYSSLIGNSAIPVVLGALSPWTAIGNDPR
jgi:hypothetical protein